MKLRRSGRLSFWIKFAIAILLVALADGFFFGGQVGTTLGVFALTLVAAVIVVQPASRHNLRTVGALVLATVFALVLFDVPNFLGWLLFWTALAVAVLSPRAAPGLNAGLWLWRLSYLAFVGMVGPILDLRRLKGRLGLPRGAVPRLMAIVAIPVIGGAIFLALFAAANPVITQLLSRIQLPQLDGPRLLFWLFCFVGIWAFLRPRFSSQKRTTAIMPVDRPIPGISVASVGLSLAVFNALFALQNGLDIAFLWSGAGLPKGVTLAEYAHRGAYPLILTALLAGVYVLVALRPGSPTARRPWLRRLVVLWVSQNVLLVASSMLRTLDYVGAYSLTRLRIAALLWMGLVAIGLMLICWRLLRDKSSAWLINANLLMAGLVLAGCSIVDLGAVAASWNVNHAREIGGDGPPLDLCYLGGLGDSSIASLSELERRPLSPDFRDRVSWVRAVALANLNDRQTQWRSWTWRGERRLGRAGALYPIQIPAAASFPGERNCDGTLVTTPSVTPPVQPSPLTRAPPS